MRKLPRPEFATRAEYGRGFCDVAFWRPYVEALWRRHELGRAADVRCPVPGTFPTFVVDGRRVVKFFGERFEGGRAFAVERHVLELVRAVEEVPSPRLIASGRLFEGEDGWDWPYLITTALEGESFTAARDGTSFEDRLEVARFLARAARRMHGLAVGECEHLRPSWERFAAVLENRRTECAVEARQGSRAPQWFLDQMDAYVQPTGELFDRQAAPCLLHGDLTADHVLGVCGESGRWRPTGLIDFGDAMMGDPLYELVNLHVDCFCGNKRLLAAFLEAYGAGEELLRDFTYRAMCLTILHEFSAVIPLFRWAPQLREAGRIEELGRIVWDLDSPGITWRPG